VDDGHQLLALGEMEHVADARLGGGHAAGSRATGEAWATV
jgi:hypothetical protein